MPLGKLRLVYLGVSKDANMRQLRDCLCKKFQPFPRNFRKVQKQPGQIVPGPTKFLDQSGRDGVAFKIDRNYW